MEWNKAKNIILIFFILLNAVLAAFMLGERRRYTVTGEQQAVIRYVLAQHGITMDAEIPRRFPPMRALLVSGYYYDEDALVEMFFTDVPSVTRIANENGEIYMYNNQAQLWIADGVVVYFNPSGLGGTPQDFIAQHFPGFEYDARSSHVDEEGTMMTFRDVYRGYMVYSNNVRFLVADAGIIEVVMQFGIIQGWDGSERPIFAPDEALITFLQRVLVFTSNPVTIWHMDIVYFTEHHNAGDERGSTHHAVPFYRIFTHEFPIPFLINAYLNFSIDV